MNENCHGCATHFEHIKYGQPQCSMPENWMKDCPCGMCLIKGMCHKLCSTLEDYYDELVEDNDD